MQGVYVSVCRVKASVSHSTSCTIPFLCQGDLGGQRTLQKKWTSFLKARVDCPVLGSRLPYIIQDTFLWCDPEQGQESCLFYAVFTPQSWVLPGCPSHLCVQCCVSSRLLHVMFVWLSIWIPRVCRFQRHHRPVGCVCLPGCGHQQGVLRREVQDPGHRGNLLCEVGDVQRRRPLPPPWSCESSCLPPALRLCVCLSVCLCELFYRSIHFKLTVALFIFSHSFFLILFPPPVYRW